jgi:acyl-CoA thioesterase
MSAPDAEAAARVKRLARADTFAMSLGATCTEAGPGLAVLQMPVTAQLLNFNGTCHGGAIFAMADSAFGLASNSHGAVAAGIDAHITYQNPVREGDTLTARAWEVSRSRRLAVYRVDVTRGDGAAVSSFTGTVYITASSHDGAPEAE